MIVETVGTMGMLGLLLAMAGLYGLATYSVSRQRQQVLRMVMRQGLGLSLAGIAIGFVMSLGAGRVLSAAFGSSDSGTVSFVVVPLALLAITLLAAYEPALRHRGWRR